MSKREHGLANGGGEGPRVKRAREIVTGADVTMGNPGQASSNSGGQGSGGGDLFVKEQGLGLWQTIKNAVNKECVTEFVLFQHQLPPPIHYLFPA
jgi:hypothetical protein